MSGSDQRVRDTGVSAQHNRSLWPCQFCLFPTDILHVVCVGVWVCGCVGVWVCIHVRGGVGDGVGGWGGVSVSVCVRTYVHTCVRTFVHECVMFTLLYMKMLRQLKDFAMRCKEL
jgi:hypothetical protein